MAGVQASTAWEKNGAKICRVCDPMLVVPNTKALPLRKIHCGCSEPRLYNCTWCIVVTQDSGVYVLESEAGIMCLPFCRFPSFGRVWNTGPRSHSLYVSVCLYIYCVA